MVTWALSFTAESEPCSFGNFHSLFHPPPSALSSPPFFFSPQMYLHLFPPDPSSHTYRRVQYITWQQQSKYSPAYLLFKATATEFHNQCEMHIFSKPSSTLSASCLDGCVWGLQWCNSLKTKHKQPWKGVRATRQIFFTISSLHIYPTSSTSPTFLPWQGLCMEFWLATLSPTSAQLLFLGEGARSKSHWHLGHLVKSCYHTRNILSVY